MAMNNTTAHETCPAEGKQGLEQRLMECAGALEAHGFKGEAELVREAAAAASYYRAGLMRLRPDYVPKLVRLLRQVRSEMPTQPNLMAEQGVHQAVCNQWGAVSVQTATGALLGLKPGEFEVVAWTRNNR